MNRVEWRRGGAQFALLAFLLLGGCCRTINGIQTAGSATSGGTGAGASTSGGSKSGSSSGGTSSGTSGSTTGTEGCAQATYTTSPGPLTPRTALAAAFGSDGMAYIAGGVIVDGGATALVERLNPDSGVVTLAPSMLTARRGFTLVASSDRRTLYAVGGFSADGGPAPSESFDVASQTWNPLPALSDPNSVNLATVLEDGQVLVVLTDDLGFDAGATTETLTDGGWQPGPEILAPSPFFFPRALAAGRGTATYLADEKLNVIGWSADAGAWGVVGPPSSVVFGSLINLSFAQASHYLFVPGGFEVYADCPLTVDNLSLDLDKPDAGWIQTAMFNSSRNEAAVAVSPDGKLFLFGGQQTSRCCSGLGVARSELYYGSYEVFDPDAGI